MSGFCSAHQGHDDDCPRCEKPAPDGQVWMCAACGRQNKRQYAMSDSTCITHAVLVYEASIKRTEHGISADAVEE